MDENHNNEEAEVAYGESVPKFHANAMAEQPGTTGQPVFDGAGALLAAIEALSPEIAARAEEMETARAMPRELFRKIAATGLFRAIRPRALGGAECRGPDMLPVLESIARADGSTGWSCMIGAEISAIWQRLDSPILDSIFGTGDEVMTRGAITPKPGITKAPGGVRVNGRWPLGSGSYPTDWIFVGGPVAEEDGSPAIGKDGRPEMMLAVLPASEVATLDTWYSIGLRATESHDVEIKDRFVPAERTAPWLRVHESGPRIGRLPIFLAVGPFHLGVVLGIARGMIDELVSLSATKRPFLNPLIRMAEDPLFQFRIGALETRLSAARTFAIAESEIIWDLAGSGSPIAPIERARFRAAMAHVHAECMTVANEIFTLAGTNILYDTSSLQRRFRDIRAVCQHACANIDITRPYGALLLGETPEMVALL